MSNGTRYGRDWRRNVEAQNGSRDQKVMTFDAAGRQKVRFAATLLHWRKRSRSLGRIFRDLLARRVNPFRLGKAVQPIQRDPGVSPRWKGIGYRSVLRRTALAAVFVFCVALRTQAADSLTVEWDPNPPEEQVLGYLLYVGTTPGVFPEVFDVGAQTSFTYPNAVAGQEYFLAIVAYNILGTGPPSELTGFSNAPPSLANPGDQITSVGQAVTLQLNGSDLEAEPLSYSASGLPPGLTIADAGLISGAATAGGTYSVTVTASDGELVSAPQIFVWAIDESLPTVAIASPTTQATYSTSMGTVALEGTASDDFGIASVTWVNNRGGSGTAAGTTAWSISLVRLMTGDNIISVTAHDLAGRTRTTAITVTSPGSSPPTVEITLPTPDPTYVTSSELLLLGGTASDEVGVTAVTWVNNRGGGGTAVINTSFPTTSPAWHVSAILLLPGVNVVTVAAWNEAGQSGTAIVTVTLNRAPVVANPGAKSSFQGVSLTLGMTAVDPDGDPVTSYSAVNLPPGLAINPSTGVVSGTPTTLGAFTVVITASDGSATGQASFSWSIASPLPGKATLVGPSGSIATTTPAFSWNADGLPTYYALSVSDASAGTPTVVWYTPAAAGCPLGGTCTVAAPRSLATGLVSWKVITWNPFGYGPWSATMNTVVEVDDPSVPTPAPGGPSGPIATRTPTYTWNAISNATWYQLSVTDALGVVREFWYSPSQVCASTPCSVTPNVLLAIGPAQWKVRAWRASGAGVFTAPVTFEATDSAPGTATLISPLTPVTTVTPSFTWNAVLGTSYYLLRVMDRDNGTIDRWYLPAAVGCPLGTGICTASPGVPLKAGAATWKVLTWNGSGYGPWSATREFLVEIADPSAPTPAALSPTGSIVNTSVWYRWTAMAGAISYRLSIRNNGGAPNYSWYTPVTVDCIAATAECNANPQLSLINGTAEWQVQAWTTTGYGPWSSVVPLTINIPLPPAPTLISPGGQAGSTSPPFQWNSSASATLYYISAYDPTGLRVDKWLTPSQAGCAGGGVCTLNAGVTLASGAGSWRVIAWNPTGYSRWSSALAFSVP
jgi:hypothetical protein